MAWQQAATPRRQQASRSDNAVLLPCSDTLLSLREVDRPRSAVISQRLQGPAFARESGLTIVHRRNTMIAAAKVPNWLPGEQARLLTLFVHHDQRAYYVTPTLYSPAIVSPHKALPCL